MPLWKMRYRKPVGVVEDCIDAPDLERAEATGRLFCEKEPGYKFIYVRPLVIATWQAVEAEPGEAPKPNGKARVGA